MKKMNEAPMAMLLFEWMRFALLHDFESVTNKELSLLVLPSLMIYYKINCIHSSNREMGV